MLLGEGSQQVADKIVRGVQVPIGATVPRSYFFQRIDNSQAAVGMVGEPGIQPFGAAQVEPGPLG